MKQVRGWIKSKKSLPEVEMLKLWKALYFCTIIIVIVFSDVILGMWMSDKPFVQHELAENLAQLIHLLEPKVAISYLKSKEFY